MTEVAAVEEPAPDGRAGAGGVDRRTPRSTTGTPERTPAWSIRADEHDVYEPAPVPVADDEVHEFVRAPDRTPPRRRPEVVGAIPRRAARHAGRGRRSRR